MPVWIVTNPDIFAVPSRSRFASMSTRVAVKPISSVAPNSRIALLEAWINCDVSLKQILLAPFSVRPVPSVWVKVVSLSAPKWMTAESLRRIKSSPITASSATLKPPSVWIEPSVVEVAAVVSSVITLPEKVAFWLLSIFNTFVWELLASVV